MKGIVVAGNILLDKINQISVYPKCGQLTQIQSVDKAVGGCVPNVAIDLMRLDKTLNVYASGKVGKDADAEYVLSVLKENGVNVDQVKFDQKATSFTDVMSISGGERTFFTYAGASANFGSSDVDDELLSAEMFHLGYFLLLDKIDKGDGLELLKRAKKLGAKTSIDLVSENSDRYSLVVPVLEYTDNIIVNEIEAQNISGIYVDIVKSAKAIKAMGVKERVIIHCPDFSICVSNDGYTKVNSLDLPNGFIKGATGAGDAFCAGSLYGIYNGWSDKEILEFASMVAVCNLSQADSISGVKSKEETIKFCSSFNRKA